MSGLFNYVATPAYLKEAGAHERAGRLASALSTLINARKVNVNNELSKFYEMNIKRLINRAQQKARSFYSTTQPVPLYETKDNPRNYVDKHQDRGHRLPPIISLTAISTRISRVEKTVASITNQTLKPHSINLYISSEPYLIDEGIRQCDPLLKRLNELGVNIYQVPNIGPYRKQVPLVIQLRATAASPRTPIITIDDDVIYPPDIVHRLMTALESENSVIAHRGRRISIEDGVLSKYSLFPPPSARSSDLNMGTGKNGIAYRLGYFPSNPDDFIGHILAPTADDIWCKWATSSYCVPTVILEPDAAYNPSLDFAESALSDRNGLFYKYNAKGANDDAMENLEAYFMSRGTGITALFGETLNG